MDRLMDAFNSLGPPWNMIVLVVLIGSFAGVVKVIALQVRAYGSHRIDMNLKRELVVRGLSAEEIERIIAAKSAITSKDSGS